MLVVMQMNVNLKAVLMVNMIVAMELVSMAHGHVTVMVTVLMAQMKLIVVVTAVLMVNLTVVPIVVHMVSVSMAAGNVMARQTVMMLQTKLTGLLLLEKIKVCGIVVMDSVLAQAMYVMAQVNFVTQAGLLTVLMAQMKA